jgi:hypothetical protein
MNPHQIVTGKRFLELGPTQESVVRSGMSAQDTEFKQAEAGSPALMLHRKNVITCTSSINHGLSMT